MCYINVQMHIRKNVANANDELVAKIVRETSFDYLYSM